MTDDPAPTQPDQPEAPRQESAARQAAPRVRRLDCSETPAQPREPAERNRPAGDARGSGRPAR